MYSVFIFYVYYMYVLCIFYIFFSPNSPLSARVAVCFMYIQYNFIMYAYCIYIPCILQIYSMDISCISITWALIKNIPYSLYILCVGIISHSNTCFKHFKMDSKYAMAVVYIPNCLNKQIWIAYTLYMSYYYILHYITIANILPKYLY